MVSKVTLLLNLLISSIMICTLSNFCHTASLVATSRLWEIIAIGRTIDIHPRSAPINKGLLYSYRCTTVVFYFPCSDTYSALFSEAMWSILLLG